MSFRSNPKNAAKNRTETQKTDSPNMSFNDRDTNMTKHLTTISPEVQSSEMHEFYSRAEQDSGIALTSNPENEQKVNPVIAYLLSLESVNSKVGMKSVLNQVAKILGYEKCENVPWHELRRNHVQAIMYKLSQRDLAPSTRNRYLSAIKGVTRESWLAGGMSGDSFERIKSIKGPRGTRIKNKGRLINPQEINQLLKSSSTNNHQIMSVRNRAVIAVMLTCGLRKSELCDLKPKDLNLSERYFTVIGKGDKEAKVFIQPATIQYIIDWLNIKNTDSKYLFTPISRGGRPLDKRISNTGITHILRSAAKNAGVSPFAPHDTRRTFATRLFAAGVDPIKVRDAMRHSSLETTQIYNIQDEELLRESIESVNIIG